MALDTRARSRARWPLAPRGARSAGTTDRAHRRRDGNVGGGAAAALARRGARVVLLGRKTSALEARATRIRAESSSEGREDPTLETLEVDLTDRDSIRRAAAEALDRFPDIDALVLSVVALGQHGPDILPDGHELIFATNVLGPFRLTQLLMERLRASGALILHVVAPFYEAIDWDDLESIRDHEGEKPYHRTKTMNRIMAAELARRSDGRISSVAFDPGFIIDKHDPTLKDRWPTGLTGFYWKVMTALVAKPPRVAGEPMARLILDTPDREAVNGALFKLDQRVTKPDKAMGDVAAGRKLWDELVRMTGASSGGQSPEGPGTHPAVG